MSNPSIRMMSGFSAADRLLPSNSISGVDPTLDLLPDVDSRIHVRIIAAPGARSLSQLEDLDRYCPGGYYPIDLGDRFACDGYRFKVVHKLSHGRDYTLWLVRETVSDRNFAFKILTADASSGEGLEFEVAWHLKNQKESRDEIKSKKDPGEDFVMDVVTVFRVNGPNGVHKCIVYKVVGPRVSAVRSRYGRLPAPVLRKIIPQIASGVSYLHSIGIVHGNLDMSNILFTIPFFEHWTNDQITAYLRMPQLIETTTNEPRSPHRPRYRTIPALLEGLEPLFFTNIKELTIQIVGFGAAFFSEGECMKIPRRTAYPLESPEGLWRAKPVVGPSSDIWTLACTIYALLSSQELFGPPPMYPLQAMANIVRVLGDLPQELSVVWEKENLRDYVACLLEHEHAPLKRTTFAKRMEALVTDPPGEGLAAREIVDLEFLLLEMLQYRPADRFSAEEVVRFLEQRRQQAFP